MCYAFSQRKCCYVQSTRRREIRSRYSGHIQHSTHISRMLISTAAAGAAVATVTELKDEIVKPNRSRHKQQQSKWQKKTVITIANNAVCVCLSVCVRVFAVWYAYIVNEQDIKANQKLYYTFLLVYFVVIN